MSFIPDQSDKYLSQSACSEFSPHETFFRFIGVFHSTGFGCSLCSERVFGFGKNQVDRAGQNPVQKIELTEQIKIDCFHWTPFDQGGIIVHIQYQPGPTGKLSDL